MYLLHKYVGRNMQVIKIIKSYTLILIILSYLIN